MPRSKKAFSTPPAVPADSPASAATPGAAAGLDSLAGVLSGRASDDGVAAAALALRRALAEEYGASSTLQRLLLDGAAVSFGLQQRIASLSTRLASVVDHELPVRPYAEPAFALAHASRPSMVRALSRLAEQVRLLERTQLMTARFLTALQEQAQEAGDDATSQSG